jgi:hypothetical protein
MAYQYRSNLIGVGIPISTILKKISLARLRDETLQVRREKKIKFWEIETNKLPLESFTGQSHLNKNGQLFKANFIFRNIQENTIE